MDLTGEYGDNDFVITRGDSRIAMTIARDEYTVQLNRDNRFLIDDYDSDTVLAYKLTKPFKLGGSYGGDGVLHFVLQEVNSEDTDNFELHIANYYKYFPRETQEECEHKHESVEEWLDGNHKEKPQEQKEEKRNWL